MSTPHSDVRTLSADPGFSVKAISDDPIYPSEEGRRLQGRPRVLIASHRDAATQFTHGVGERLTQLQDLASSAFIGKKTASNRGDDVIWFQLDTEYQDDTELELMFPDHAYLAAATFIRDLHVVTSYHLDNMLSRGSRFAKLNHKARFRNIGSANCIIAGISDFITELNSIRETLAAAFSEGDVVPGMRGLTSTRPHVLPMERQYPTHFSGFYPSNLISSYVGMSRCLPPHLIEIADYCLAQHTKFNPRELLFEHRGGHVVLRQDMLTMDSGMVIDPIIINAWAVVVIESWKQRKCPLKTCLDVVVCESITSEEALMQKWLQWIRSCNIAAEIQTAQVVFIPFYVNAHYNLLVVNLLTRRVFRVDTTYRKDRITVWSDYAALIVDNFCKLMERCHNTRKMTLDDFNFELVNPPWSTPNKDANSGLTVMHLLGNFEGSTVHIPDVKMRKEHIQVRMRISLCAAIALSRVNVHKKNVLSAAREFHDYRCAQTGESSEEEAHCRRIFDWFPNF